MGRKHRTGFKQEFFFFFGLYVVSVSVILFYPRLGTGCLVAVSIFLAMRLFAFLILGIIFPAFYTAGKILRDFTEAVTTVYDVTVGPVFRSLVFLARAGHRYISTHHRKTQSAEQEDSQKEILKQPAKGPSITEKEQEERRLYREKQRASLSQEASRQEPLFDTLSSEQSIDYEAAKVNHWGSETQLIAEQPFNTIEIAWNEVKILQEKRKE